MSLTSIIDVGTSLRSYLVDHGCPLDVVYGPEPKTTSWGRERIVIEHDVDAKDSFGAPRGLHINAKHRYTATDGHKLTIYVRSAVPGAKTFEHRSRAKLVRETVVAGLEFVAATNKNKYEPTAGGFVTPPDLADSDQPGGAAYELKFTYQLPIRAVTFVGEARPEGTLAHMTSTTKVSRSGASDDTDLTMPPATAETACGD